VIRLLIRHPRAGIGFIKFGAKGMRPAIKAFERGDDAGALRVFMAANTSDAAVEGIPEAMFQRFVDNVGPLKAQIKAGFPPFAASDARAIRVPALLVSGAESPAHIKAVTDRLAKLVPDADRLSCGLMRSAWVIMVVSAGSSSSAPGGGRQAGRRLTSCRSWRKHWPEVRYARRMDRPVSGRGADRMGWICQRVLTHGPDGRALVLKVADQRGQGPRTFAWSVRPACAVDSIPAAITSARAWRPRWLTDHRAAASQLREAIAGHTPELA